MADKTLIEELVEKGEDPRGDRDQPREEREVKVEAKKPVAAPADDEETRFKKYVSERYGIEDDPDAWKGKHAELRAAQEALPKYHEALERAQSIITESQRRQVPQQQQAPGTPDWEKLRDLAMRDPFRAMLEFEQYRSAAYDAKAQEAAKMTEIRMMAARDMEESNRLLREHFPDSYKPDTDLHKMGKHIYLNEMSEIERAHPRAQLIATERAAGRLAAKGGYVPAPREEVESQRIERDARRKPDKADKPKTTSKDRDIAEQMGIDPDGIARNRQYRQEGKNVRVE